MARYAGVILWLVLPLFASAGESPSAFNAIAVLPREELKSLARIVAYDGAPSPDRWYYLVHDPNAASGLREYVVANGELVVSRGISQFAQRLTEADIIGHYALQIDSDGLAKIATEYAAANNLTIDTLNYQLLKDAGAIEPRWQANCLDKAGNVFGTLVVTATSGDVVSHVGFRVAPTLTEEQRSTWKRESDSEENKTRIATVGTQPERKAAETRNTPKKTTADSSKRRSTKKRTASSQRSLNRRVQPATVAAPPQVLERRRPHNPVGNFFRRILRL